MKTVVELIMLNSERHKEFEQYCAVIEMAELHKLTNPDICIESCKALVEGISKTILVNVDPTKTHATIDKENLSVSKLFKDAVDKLGEKSEDFEPDFAGRFGGVVKVLGELRNKRGDISHGRVAPKQVFSSARLSTSVLQMTEGIVAYLLEHYYRLPASAGQMDYEAQEMALYNDWLDETVKNFPIETVRYSEVLFDKDYDAYAAIYENDYLPSLEPEGTPQDAEPEQGVESAVASGQEPTVAIPDEAEKPVSGIEDLVVDFDEDAFWTTENEGVVRAFAETAELDFEKLKLIISNCMTFHRGPRSGNLFEAYTGTLRGLKDWLVVKDELIDDLQVLIEKLSSSAKVV